MLIELQNAYDTIRDPDKRRAYDIRWMGIRDHLQAQRESDKCQAEAAETARKRATEGRAKKQKEDDARQERLRSLEMFKSRYDSDIFELNRVVRKLTADFKRLQDQDDEDLRKERKRNSWWTYLSSPIYGKVNETDEQKQKRETERLHRLASKSIKRSELQGKEAKLQTLQDALQNVNSKIAAEKKKAEDEAPRRSRLNVQRKQPATLKRHERHKRHKSVCGRQQQRRDAVWKQKSEQKPCEQQQRQFEREDRLGKVGPNRHRPRTALLAPLVPPRVLAGMTGSGRR